MLYHSSDHLHSYRYFWPVSLQLRINISDIGAELDKTLEAVADRLFIYQVEQELPIYVVPRRPLARALADAERQGSRPHRLLLDEVYSRP